jgi:ribosomal protein S18 acetylase RimI-like enzyme
MHVRSQTPTESDSYLRAAATLLASWEVDAHGAAGAELVRADAFAAGVFPNGPERDVFNNVLIRRGLGRVERGQAIDDLRSVYSKAGIDRFAAWAHDSDSQLRAELLARGFKLEESSRLMAMSLEGIELQPGEIEVERFDWQRYLAYLRSEGLPEGLLSGVDPDAYHVFGIRVGGTDAATAIAFDHDGDCGIFNMGTLEPFRRRGLGTALLTRHLQEGAERGCSTASLQATPIAEGVYRSVGFQDLGHFFEYVPAASHR